MRCDECRHYLRRSDYEDRGWCRRYPPTPVPKKFGEYPLVAGGGWCGEYGDGGAAEPRRDG